MVKIIYEGKIVTSYPYCSGRTTYLDLTDRASILMKNKIVSGRCGRRLSCTMKLHCNRVNVNQFERFDDSEELKLYFNIDEPSTQTFNFTDPDVSVTVTLIPDGKNMLLNIDDVKIQGSLYERLDPELLKFHDSLRCMIAKETDAVRFGSERKMYDAMKTLETLMGEYFQEWQNAYN